VHNLRDFARITEIYRDIREHVRPGGIFLNLDLFNAPTAELSQRYDAVTSKRRQREGTPGRLEALLPRRGRAPARATTGPFPADVDQHLAALRAAGLTDVDCFWKDLRRALVGGYA
jgi:tRNA (cmo5U34)-methyltransferase